MDAELNRLTQSLQDLFARKADKSTVDISLEGKADKAEVGLKAANDDLLAIEALIRSKMSLLEQLSSSSMSQEDLDRLRAELEAQFKKELLKYFGTWDLKAAMRNVSVSVELTASPIEWLATHSWCSLRSLICSKETTRRSSCNTPMPHL